MITTSEACARRPLPLKATNGQALAMDGTASGAKSGGVPRTPAQVAWTEGRDVCWTELTKDQPVSCEPEWMKRRRSTVHPVHLRLHRQAQGIQHSTAGYLLGAMNSFRTVFDFKQDDVYWCTADGLDHWPLLHLLRPAGVNGATRWCLKACRPT